MTAAVTSPKSNIASLRPETSGVPAEGFSREVSAAYENWDFEKLPDAVVRRIKLFVLDTLGVIAAASNAPGIGELNRLFSGWEKTGPSTALIGKWRASPPTAALANGAAAHALDYDDNHDPGRVHAYAVILPAVLATAEALDRVSGRDFIVALATGVELQARLGLAAPKSMPLGWHPTTVMGALGAGAAAARLLQLHGNSFSDAIGLSFHQAAGTIQALNDGTLAKRAGPGFSARNGVTAAFLAASGLTGPARYLEGDAGLFNVYARAEVAPSELLDGLGSRWEILTHSMKPYPCCRCTHNAIAIGKALHAEGVAADSIESVVIGMGKTNNKIVGGAYDVSRNSMVHAQFNACYCFAAALIHGEVELATFQAPQITEPAVAALAARASVAIDDTIDPAAMSPTRVTIGFRDGRRDVRFLEHMEGSPEQPLSETEVVEKFVKCMNAGLNAGRSEIDRLANIVLDMDNLEDVTDIVKAFPVAP
jgi:2-methylcitrate dehydratase PrpD